MIVADAQSADDYPTVAAVGIIAFICQTMALEAVGHGFACVLLGGQVTAVAPMWMRCSQTGPLLSLAGPAVNMLVATICGVALVTRRRSTTISYFLWLSFAFNLLVASGYLVVAGAMWFGDWSVVLQNAQPRWLWRIALILVGGGGYYLGLLFSAALYARWAHPSFEAERVLRRRTIVSAAAAALVGVAAEVAGGRVALTSLALPVGCTLVIGYSLSVVTPRIIPEPGARARYLPRQPEWIIAAALLAAAFIGWIGPVAQLVTWTNV